MTHDKLVNISGGEIQGFIQENQGTVNQNFIYQVSELISESTVGTEKPLTQLEYRQRKVLLSKVKEYWLTGVLEKSLQTNVMIELGLEQQLNAVESPFSGLEESSPASSRQVLPVETSATKFFHQIGAGRSLLILGDPGAGKTLTLLRIARKLIAQAEENINRLIPVVFNLSSWGSKRHTITDWLLKELWHKYQVPHEVSQDWIKNQQLLLLLDGLDEVKPELRSACVKSLNQFMQEHGQTEMVVCSRFADYEALSSRLLLRGAIYLRPLTPQQVNQYLDNAGAQLEAVKTLLREDKVLQELAKSPLTLSIITLAYQGKNVAELCQTESVEERRQHLFDAYIERLFERKGAKQQYSKKQVKHWLTWLAQQMSRTSQTVFLIEQIQPSWLPKDSQRLLYGVGVSLTVGITAAMFHVAPLCSVFAGIRGLVTGLIGGLIAGLGYGILGGLITRWQNKSLAPIVNSLTLGLLFGSVFWLVLGVQFGLTYGVLYALCGVIVYKFSIKDIEPVDTLKWSWRKAFKNLGLGLVFVVILAVTNEPIFGLIFGLLLWFILSWEKRREIDQTTYPNQGIWKSAQDTLRITAVVGLGSGLVLGLIQQAFFLEGVNSLVFGLANGIMFAYAAALLSIQGSGFVGCKHLILRLLLWRGGYIPWNYAHFLNYAVERIFLQKVGGGYIFAHRKLLEYFAHRNQATVGQIYLQD